jgi:tRNA:m4X modification enzyme
MKYDRFSNDFDRLNVDIKDLALGKVPDLIQIEQEDSLPLVAFSKHLCGAAPDLTLVCLDRYFQAGGDIHCAVIALCCHHLCSVETYCGSTWLSAQGFNSTEIGYLGAMGSWAICGQRNSTSHEASSPSGTGKGQPDYRNLASDSMKLKQDNSPQNPSVENHPIQKISSLPLDPKLREKIGFKVKRVLDFGRVMWLRDRGYDAHLVYYVNCATSPENCALIISRSRKPCLH